MLHSYLRRHTESEHQLLEKQFLGILKKVGTVNEYTAFLKRIASFLIPLETLIHQQPLKSLVPDINSRKRTADLIRDIQHFDPAWALAEKAPLPIINNPLEAMGALYVLEGSTMGGPIIAGIIRKQTGIGSGLSYFENYQENRKQMWVLFCDWLNDASLNPHHEIISTAAISCFNSYRDWLIINSSSAYATTTYTAL